MSYVQSESEPETYDGELQKSEIWSRVRRLTVINGQGLTEGEAHIRRALARSGAVDLSKFLVAG